MAIQSRVLWTSGKPNNPASVTIFWDDAASPMVLTRVIIDNTQGDLPVRMTATVTSNGRTFSTTVQPGDTFDQNIPTNPANRLAVFINAQGRLDGVDWNVGQ